MAKVTINGQLYAAEAGQTILQVCKANGINVPTFCYDPRLKPGGTCRICVVEIAGDDKLRVSCAFEAKDGMVIDTNSAKVKAERKSILENLLEGHNTECLTCVESGDCKLQEYAYDYEVDPKSFKATNKNIVVESVVFTLDESKCIKCGLCVKTAANLQHCDALTFKNGKNAGDGFDFSQDKCVSCGNCVFVCPTGALTSKTEEPIRKADCTATQTTCTYCGVGCQIMLYAKDNKVVYAEPKMDAVNNGLLCVKGRYGFHFINHAERVKTPLIRDKKGGELREATWEEAYALIKEKLGGIKEKHGGTAVGFFGSGKASIEDNYMLQKFARAVIGSNNIDCCARL
ncbi:MAG: 2Fe-2S iron-sulfur cluster-binding protein [Defluviitaleaceae bacterium]|nr:2Fe-2S iron-sulfur cluster-binding protein [Defluviitaleaceae bacterium]